MSERSSLKETDEVLEHPGIKVSKRKIAEFCRRWKIRELSLFGSVLRPDFRRHSDVDVLVTFSPGASRRMDDLLKMKEELEKMFGRPVDLVGKRLVEASRNYIRREHILSHRKTLYVA